MKKVVTVIIGILFWGLTNMYAINPIDLGVRIIDPTNMGPGHSKTPIQPPTIWQDDYQVIFESGHPDYVLNIKDEDGEVVYTTVVYSAQTEVVLPSSLSGDYEVELVMGNWLFTGWINL